MRFICFRCNESPPPTSYNIPTCLPLLFLFSEHNWWSVQQFATCFKQKFSCLLVFRYQRDLGSVGSIKCILIEIANTQLKAKKYIRQTSFWTIKTKKPKTKALCGKNSFLVFFYWTFVWWTLSSQMICRIKCEMAGGKLWWIPWGIRINFNKRYNFFLLRLRPNYEHALNNLALILMHHRRKNAHLDEAEALLWSSVRAQPEFATAWNNLGKLKAPSIRFWERMLPINDNKTNVLQNVSFFRCCPIVDGKIWGN